MVGEGRTEPVTSGLGRMRAFIEGLGGMEVMVVGRTVWGHSQTERHTGTILYTWEIKGQSGAAATSSHGVMIEGAGC